MSNAIYTDEIWVDIVGFVGMYQISSEGKVKSLTRSLINSRGQYRVINERILKLKTDKDGYLRVGLRKAGQKQKYFFIHRLVCTHFKQNPSDKPTVNHLDGDKKNNKINNLEFATYEEQMEHAYKIGLQKPKYNEESGNNFLKNSEILSMREMYKSGLTQYKIAEIFKCSQGHVSVVVNNKKRPLALNT